MFDDPKARRFARKISQVDKTADVFRQGVVTSVDGNTVTVSHRGALWDGLRYADSIEGIGSGDVVVLCKQGDTFVVLCRLA